MSAIETADTPRLVADVTRMEGNIRVMSDALSDAGVSQRPHFKTSKIIEVARRQLASGAVGFTCATSAEVEALLTAGINDIFWANAPATPRKAELAAAFNARGRVAVGLDSIELATRVSKAANRAGVVIPVRLEVDTGLRRTGVSPDASLQLADGIAELAGLELEGVYIHEGQLASLRLEREELIRHGREAARSLVNVAAGLREAGHPVPVVSVGSTPGWDSAPFEPGVTEARAGTYVFYDANQWRLGSAAIDSCALTVHSTVVSVVRPGEIVIDAGIKAMSSDGSNRDRTFGVVVDGGGQPVEGVVFARAYEEHGVLEGDPAVMPWQVGDCVRIIPNHACGAVNMWSRVIAERFAGPIESWDVVGRY